MKLVGFDTETHRIGAGAVAPRVVCLSVATRGDDGSLETHLVSQGDEIKPHDLFYDLAQEEDVVFVGANPAFDLAALCAGEPELLPTVFGLLEEGRVLDVQVRQKLHNLATVGNVDQIEGSGTRISYSLRALAAEWLGLDLEDVKEADDSWRLNYDMLDDGRTGDEFPPDAREYAINDAVHALDVFLHQNMVWEDDGLLVDGLSGVRTMPTEQFQVAASFCLFLMTVWGIKVDRMKYGRLKKWVEDQLDDASMQLLVDTGILRPGVPPRPMKKNPNKLTKGKPPSIDTKRLSAHIERVCRERGISIQMTPTGRISSNGDWLKELAPFDPVIEQYVHRASLQKLVSTELPRMDAEIVHPSYDVLKETGRTSSFASKLFPSTNIQNPHPFARTLFEARPGTLLCSVDYSALEMVTLAQTCFELFGRSKLRQLICSGEDPHSYMGAQLAHHLDADFREACSRNNIRTRDDISKMFLMSKTSDLKEAREFYKLYRTFAKPVNLGFPGGLGPATFVDFAKATYGVEVDEMQAHQFKQLWLETFPELEEYFAWINQACEDPRDADRYCYTSPYGMHRARASYCAACNGKALQTPAAEGAKTAVILVSRACYDRTRGSILFGSRPVAFVHDEIVAEVPVEKAHECAEEIIRLMVEGMSYVVTDTPVRAEPALMRHWHKAATAVYDERGRLKEWIPTEEDPWK